MSDFDKVRKEEIKNPTGKKTVRRDFSSGKRLSQYVNPTFQTGNEGEEVYSQDTAARQEEIRRANEVENLKAKYKLPQGLRDKLITNDNLDTPEKREGVIRDRYVINKDNSLIPKNLIDEVNDNTDKKYSYSDFQNMTNDDFKKFIDGKKEENRLKTIDTASENAKKLVDYVKSGLKSKEDAGNRIKAGEEYLKGLEKMTKETGEPMPNLLEQGVIKGFIPKDFMDNPELFGGASGPKNIKNMSDIEKVAFAQERKKYLDSLEEKYKDKGYDKSDIDYLLFKQRMSGDQDVTKIEQYIDQSLAEGKKEEPGIKDYLAEFGGALVQSVSSSLKTLVGLQLDHASIPGVIDDIRGVTDPRERMLFQFAKNLDSVAESWKDPKVKQTFGRDFVQGFGSMISFALPGTLAGKVGLSRNLVTMMLGALMNGGDEYERILTETNGDQTKATIGLLVNAGLGLTEAIPIERMFKGLSGLTGRNVAKLIIKRGAAGFLEEGIQEFGQQLGQGITAKLLDTSKQSGAEILGDSLYAGLLGGLLGTLMNGATISGSYGISALKTKAIKNQLSAKQLSDVKDLVDIYDNIELQFPKLTLNDQDKVKSVLNKKNVGFSIDEKADEEGNPINFLRINDKDKLASILMKDVDNNADIDEPRKKAIKDALVKNDKKITTESIDKKVEEDKAKKEDVTDGTKDLLDLLGDPEKEQAKLDEAKKILDTKEVTFDPDQVKTPKAEYIRQQIAEKEKELEGETDKQVRFSLTADLNDLTRRLDDEIDKAFNEEENKLNSRAGYTPKVMKAKMPELNKKTIKQTVKDFYSGEYGDMRDEYQEHTATIHNEIDNLEKQLKAVKGKDSKEKKEKLQEQIAAREINLAKLEETFLAEHEKSQKFISDKIKEKAKEHNIEISGDDVQNITDNINEYLFNEGREAIWNDKIETVLNNEINDALGIKLSEKKEFPSKTIKKTYKTHSPYEFTKDELLEYVSENGKLKISDKKKKEILKYHKEEIQKALAEGKTVSEEVLKDYPDLKNAQVEESSPEKVKAKKKKVYLNTKAGSEPDEDGYYDKDLPEVIKYELLNKKHPDTAMPSAVVHLLQLENGKWISESGYSDVSKSMSGRGGPLGNTTEYDTKEEALKDAFNEILKGTEEARTKKWVNEQLKNLDKTSEISEVKKKEKKLKDFVSPPQEKSKLKTPGNFKKGDIIHDRWDVKYEVIEPDKAGMSHLAKLNDDLTYKLYRDGKKVINKINAYGNYHYTLVENVSVKPIEKEAVKKKKVTKVKANEPKVSESSRKTVDFPIADLNQDVKRFQQRETEYAEETVNKIVNNYKPQELEDIFIWKDPKNGKIYNLSGHSRIEALKRLKIKTIPARYFEGTEAEAIKFARNSNNQTPESVVARANYYRDQRAAGVSEKEILKEANLQEAKNSNLIIALSHLNPKGRTFSALKMLSQSSDKTKDNITTIARWVGTARQEFKSLTNQHENEMFDFLMDEKNNKLIRSKDQWLDRIGNVVNNLNFKADEPLNLKSAIVKTPTDIAREKRIEELTNEKRQILKKIKDRKDLMESKGKIPEEIKKDKKILELQKVAQIIEQDIIDAKNIRSGGDIDMFAEPKPEKKKLADYVNPPVEENKDSKVNLENAKDSLKPESKLKDKIEKKLEIADKEIDDIWNEFIDKIDKSKDGPKAAGINLDKDLIEIGSRLVGAYINKGIYKLESILYEAFQKFGESRFREVFLYVKDAYTTYIIHNEDPEIESKMTDIKVVKNLKPESVISGQVETPQELTEEEKQDFWKEDTEESLQKFLDNNDLNVKLPEEFFSDLERDGFVFLKKNTASLVMKYINMMNKTRTPGTINTDEVRKLFEDAGYNRYNANDFHEPASELTKLIFEYFLWKYKSKTGKSVPMLFMIGSPGSGKTSSIAAMLGDKFNDYPLVFDGVLADYRSLTKKLKKAFNNYYDPNIAYVYCPPLKAFKQSLDRMQHELRPVPLTMFLNTYDIFPTTLRKIHELDGMFSYVLIDNSGGKGEGKYFSIEDISNFDYNYNRKDFLDLIQNYYNEGKINEQQLEGILSDNKTEVEQIRNTSRREKVEEIHNSLDESAGIDRRGEGKDKTGESESKQEGGSGTKEDSSSEGKGEKPKGEVEDAKAQSDRLLNGKGNRNDLPGSSETLPTENVQGNDGSGLSGTSEESTSGRSKTKAGDNEGRNSGDVSTNASLGTEQGENTDRSGSGRGTGRLARSYDTPPGAKNIVLTDDLVLDKTFVPTKKAADNIAAIRLLRQLTTENRLANPEEQLILAKYVGWGGIPHIFDEQKSDWKGMRDELKSLISEEDYKSARASTLNAHYTHPGVIRPMWNALKLLGFKGGRILDPSMGTGHFFGFMPQDLSNKSLLYGVELDNTTGQIAKHLYPKAKIEVKGFEETNYPNDYFDLAISNIPFGNFSIFDESIEPELRKSIHNYFFAKALDQVRPGGIVAFVTSSWTLDAKDSKVRQYLNEHANFVGSIRLPQGAFSKNANTEVVTDIIFLQKRTPRDKSIMNKFTARTEKLINGKKYFINEYYDKYPGMVMGEWSERSDQYNKGEKIKTVVYKGENLESDIDKAIKENIPDKIFKSKSEKDKVPLIKEYLSTENDYSAKWDGEFFIEGNDIYRKVNNGVIKIEFLDNEKDQIRRDKMIRQIEINELARNILQYQTISMDDSLYQDDMKKLNERYDEYVEKYGFLNTKENMNVLFTHDYGHDPNVPYIMSLENWNDEKETATKGDRFSIRTAFPEKTEFKIESISDAINVSNNLKGGLDMENIAKLYDQTIERTIKDAVDEDLIFFDGQQWQDKDDYLSGNVVGKLNEAKALLEETKDPQYERNISELEKVQPRRVLFEEIILHPGTNVIPVEDYRRFIKDIFNLSDDNIADLKITYNPYTSRWTMDLTKSVRRSINTIEVNEIYGVRGADGLQILLNLLNSKPTKVRKEVLVDGERKSVIDVENTSLAGQKTNELSDKFKSYFNDNAQLRKKIEDHYNNYFNVLANKNYNGQHLTLPGLNNNIRQNLFTHVKDAVHRIIKDRDVLLAHCVGAGKTWSMSISAMELRRLGLAKKPVHVVKNHMLGQYTKEFLMLYPNAKLLVLYPESITPLNRSLFLSRIANGDWDSVIIPATVFERLRVSVEEERSYIQEEVDLLQQAFDDAVQDDLDNGVKRPSRTVKAMEKQLKNLRARLTAISSAKSKKDIGIAFEELGVDQLFVDEAHGYKNLYFPTKLQLKGLSDTHAKKSQDMFMKIRALRRKNGKCITFATGTPVSNTMAELFTMQRYLQPHVLKELNLERFDDWVNIFGSITSDYEIDAYGRLQQITRLRRFENPPEIMRIFRQVADIKTKDDLNLKVPQLKNGERTVVESPENEHIISYTKYLLERFERVLSGAVKPEQDNPLTITNDGKKASLDLRLVGLHQDLPDSKINKAVKLISKHYKETQDTLGTQLVFMDYGVPKKAVDNRKNIKARQNAITYITEIKAEDIDKEISRYEKILIKAKPTKNAEKLDSKGNYANYMIKFLEGIPRESEQLRKKYIDEYILALEDSITFLTMEQEEEKIDLFQDMKDKLIKLGIPANKIAFSSDPNTTKQKQQLYEDVNAGKVRVLIGTTAKLSEGVNIQKRLVALYHMNPTWKPSEMEQREGRILRSGNENAVVNIYNMVQVRSFDVMNYSMLKNKQIMFAQVMSKDVSVRSIEDMDDRAFEFGEVSAVCSGDPRLLERMILEKDVLNLNHRKVAFEQQQQRIQNEIKDIPKIINDYTKRLERVQKIKPDEIPEKFKIEINGKTFEDVDLTEEEKKKAADNRKIIVAINKTLEDGIKITKEENAAFEKANKELEEYEKKRDQGSARIRATEEMAKIIPSLIKEVNDMKKLDSGLFSLNKKIGSYLNFDVVVKVFPATDKLMKDSVKIMFLPRTDPEYKENMESPEYATGYFNDNLMNNYRFNVPVDISHMLDVRNISSNRGVIFTILNAQIKKIVDTESYYANKLEEYKKKQESYKDFKSTEFPKEAELKEKETRLNELDRELSMGTANNNNVPPPVDDLEDPIDKIDNPENDENDDDEPPIQAQKDNILKKYNPQIFTKAFKKWFGDWENDPNKASVVVDILNWNGKILYVPKVVYHGTTVKNNFDKFNTASYFSESPVDASDYAGGMNGAKVYPTYINVRNPLDFIGQEVTFETPDGSEHTEVVDALVELNDVQFKSLIPEGFKDYQPEVYTLPLYAHIENDKFIKLAKKLGYDGITLIERGFTNYMVFNPNQIKSAISNEGTFDPGDDRIQKQINAYHGTGAEFDKFSSEYIGTGEGVQAFGYGLYFTSKEEIAKAYAKKLAKYKYEELLVNGKKLSENEIAKVKKNKYLAQNLINILADGNINRELRYLKDQLEGVEKSPKNYPDPNGTRLINLKEAINYLENNKISTDVKNQHVYSVALHKGKNSNEYTYLNWYDPVQDNIIKKINNQLKKSGYDHIQFTNDYKKVEELVEDKINYEIDDYLDKSGLSEDDIDIQEFRNNMDTYAYENEAIKELNYVHSGKALYQRLSEEIWNMEGDRADWTNKTMDKEASAMLLDAGIDGIRYLANSLSNAARNGKIDYNYVVFDDSVIDVEQHYQFQKGKAEVNNYITALAKKINKVFPDTKLNFVTSNELFEILKKTKGGEEFQTASEVPLGMVYRGEVYINTDKARLDTPIHEFGHIWDNWAEKYQPELWKQGIKLVAKETALINWIKKQYPELKGKWIYKEALAHIIGVNGANIVSQTRIGNKTLKEVFQIWLKKLWDSVRKAFGKDITNVAALNPETMTLQQFTEAIAKDLLGDNVISRAKPTNNKSFQVQDWGESIKHKQDKIKSEINFDQLIGNDRQLGLAFISDREVYFKISNKRKVRVLSGKNGREYFIRRHYDSGYGEFKANEIFLIPQVVKEGKEIWQLDGKKKYFLKIKGIEYTVILGKDDTGEFLFNFYTDRGNIKNEEPTLRNNTKTIGSGWQPSDGFRPSSVYQNKISRSSEKNKISFQKINDKTREFYSPLEKIIQGTKQEKYTSKDFLNWLKNQKGYKPAEFEWIGLEDFLSDKRSVTKQELLDYVAQNKVVISDVTLGNSTSNDWVEVKKGKKWTLTVKNHRRKITIDKIGDLHYVVEYPSRFVREFSSLGRAKESVAQAYKNNTMYEKWILEGENDNYREVLITLDSKDQFKSGHFKDVFNIITHLRVDDRKDTSGKKILFVEEVQSDWNIAGRSNGFNSKEGRRLLKEKADNVAKISTATKEERAKLIERDGEIIQRLDEIRFNLSGFNDIPDMPFKGNKWTELAIKKAIQIAAAEGHDGIAFVNGEQTAERYDLSKQVESIYVKEYMSAEHFWKFIKIQIKNNPQVQLKINKAGKITSGPKDDFIGKNLDEVVGKDLAKKIMDMDQGTIKGDDLKIGGQWAVNLYDKQIPAILKEYAKKFGGKVTEYSIDSSMDSGYATLMADKRFMIYNEDTGEMHSFYDTREEGEEALEDLRVVYDRYLDFTVADSKFLKPTKQIGLAITPDLKEKIGIEGMPMFQRDNSQIYSKEFKKFFGDWENDPDNASKVTVGWSENRTFHNYPLDYQEKWKEKNPKLTMPDFGKPKVMYHGTTAIDDYSVFKRTTGDIGIHFGTEEHANNILYKDLKYYRTNTRSNKYLQHRTDPTIRKKGIPRILPVYLNIKNPLWINDAGGWSVFRIVNFLLWESDKALKLFQKDMGYLESLKARYENLRKPNGELFYDSNETINENKEKKEKLEKELTDELVKYIENKGFDGFYYMNEYENKGSIDYDKDESKLNLKKQLLRKRLDNHTISEDEFFNRIDAINEEISKIKYKRYDEPGDEDTSYIVFHPNQIKSAIGNSGEFDSDEPDIMMQKVERYENEGRLGEFYANEGEGYEGYGKNKITATIPDNANIIKINSSESYLKENENKINNEELIKKLGTDNWANAFRKMYDEDLDGSSIKDIGEYTKFLYRHAQLRVKELILKSNPKTDVIYFRNEDEVNPNQYWVINKKILKKDNRTYYSTHDDTISFSDFIETEVNERGNYSLQDIEEWKNKYLISDNDKVVWVATNKHDANYYNLPSEEYENRYNIPDEELEVHEWSGNDGFIIPESDDGENGFLFVKKPFPKGQLFEIKIQSVPKGAGIYRYKVRGNDKNDAVANLKRLNSDDENVKNGKIRSVSPIDSNEPDIMFQKDKKTGKKTDKKNSERSGKSSEKSKTERTGKEEFENPDAQSPEDEAKSFEDNSKNDRSDPGQISKAAQLVSSILESSANANNTHTAGDKQFDEQFKPRDKSLWGQRKKLQELAELLKNKFVYLQKIKADPNIDKKGKAEIIYGIDQLREEITNLLRNKINLIIHNVFGHFTGEVSTKVMNVGKYANAKRLEAIYNNPDMTEQQENLGYDKMRVAKIVANLESKLSQEEKTAYNKLRIILDHYGKMLVKAGLIEEAHDQYFPFRVLEYINDFGIMGTGAKRVQKIIPGSSKKMKGTGEHYDIDAVSIIMEHLTQNERAIAFNKFEENILKKFDDQTKYNKETKKIEPGYREYYFDPRRNFFKVKGLADNVLENLIGNGTIQDEELLGALRDYLSVGRKKGHRYIIPIGLAETIGDLHESVIAKTIPIVGALTRFWKKQMVSRLGLFTIFFHSRNMRTDNLKTFVNHPEAYIYLPQIDKFLSKKMNLAQRGFINLVDVTGGTKILKTGARIPSVKHTFTEQELNQYWNEGISAGTFSGQMTTEALSVSERELKTLFTSPGLKKSFRELKDKLYVTKLLDKFDDVSRMRETKLRFDLYSYLRAVKNLSPAEAHLEVGKTMINYNHFTPTEKRWFINFLYPFYSWRKGNIETTIQQLRTGNSKQRARLISAMILSGLIPAIYNYIWYPDDEEKLQNDQTKRYISESFHLATPYFDENGNRIYIYDNNFVDDITSMLGTSEAISETRKMMSGQHSIQEGLGHLAWNTTKGTYDKLIDETNPYMKLLYEYRANRNTFYGFPIYKEDDSEFNKMVKSLTYGSGIMSRNLSTLRNLIVGPASMTMKGMRLSGLPVTGVDITRGKTNFDEMNKAIFKERLKEIKDLEKDRDKAKENALKTKSPEDVKIYQELNKQLIIMRKTSPDYKEYLKQNRLKDVEIQKLLKQNIP